MFITVVDDDDDDDDLIIDSVQKLLNTHSYNASMAVTVTKS
jgi:hypothetical protein